MRILSGFDGRRRVIDISGDGPNNRGHPVTPVRDEVTGAGIIINGLPLVLRPSRTFAAMDLYYGDCVIGGPGAFVLPVQSADEFAAAIRHKLILEIAGIQPVRLWLAQGRAPVDCRIGDRS